MKSTPLLRRFILMWCYLDLCVLVLGLLVAFVGFEMVLKGFTWIYSILRYEDERLSILVLIQRFPFFGGLGRSGIEFEISFLNPLDLTSLQSGAYCMVSGRKV